MKKGAVILGHPRSGTTLLRRLLNAHSQIASPPETHLLSACSRFLETNETAGGVDMGVLSGLEFAGFKQDDVVKKLRELAFTYFNTYAEQQGKSRWVEKTAFDIYHLSTIESLCQNQALFIGIIRHPLDVAVSSESFCAAAGVYPKDMHSYIRRYPQPIEAFVQSWIDTTNALISLGQRQPDNCIICRYEDLVEAPQEILKEILEFLGEEFEESILEKAFIEFGALGFSDHESYKVDAIHSKSVEKWRSLPTQQIAKMSKLVNPLLEQCGYSKIDDYELQTNEESRRGYLNSLLIHAAKE